MNYNQFKPNSVLDIVNTQHNYEHYVSKVDIFTR